MQTIAYEKYESMDKRSLFNALLNAEKKFERMRENLNVQKELIKFLKAKTKKKIDEKEISIPALDEAIAEYENGDIIKCGSFEEYQRKMREE